jgi:hypothetical protein
MMSRAVSRVGSCPATTLTYAFGTARRKGSGDGTHRRLGDSLVLDQHTLEFERRNPEVRALEDIVGAPDVGDVALVVAGGDVARVVITAGGGGCAALIGIVIAGHQPERAV